MENLHVLYAGGNIFELFTFLFGSHMHPTSLQERKKSLLVWLL
jgi:hypothetical protein